MDEKELSYLAGFFDGEGCVGAYPHNTAASRKNYGLRVRVDGIHQDSIRRFHRAFGGTVAFQKARGTRRGIWSWQVSGAGAKTALSELLPHLTVKKEQAFEALKFPLGYVGKDYERNAADKAIIADRLKALKVACA